MFALTFLHSLPFQWLLCQCHIFSYMCITHFLFLTHHCLFLLYIFFSFFFVNLIFSRRRFFLISCYSRPILLLLAAPHSSVPGIFVSFSFFFKHNFVNWHYSSYSHYCLLLKRAASEEVAGMTYNLVIRDYFYSVHYIFLSVITSFIACPSLIIFSPFPLPLTPFNSKQ